jgi:hypothetical protein
MDKREERAIVIAALCRIDRVGGAWAVPSQTVPGRKYAVNLGEQPTCTCPDCQEGGFVCKHIRAVKIVLKRELGMDGSITETASVTIEDRKTYRRTGRRIAPRK